MSSEIYFSKGNPTCDTELIQKIKRDSFKCWWHQDSYENGETEEMEGCTGWVDEKGILRDICHILRKRDQKKVDESKVEREKIFLIMEKKILLATEEVEKFSNKLDTIADLRGKKKAVEKKLEDKFVLMNGVVRGSKKKRRFKKNNKRDLTERELAKLEEEKKDLAYREDYMEEEASLEDTLYKVFKLIYDVDKKVMSSYHLKYGYHRSTGLYNILDLRLNCLKDQINRLEYNDLQKDPETSSIKLGEVHYFEDTVEEVKQKIEEDMEYEKAVAYQKSREVSTKTRFFVTETGQRIELGKNVKQVILHK